MLAPVNKRQLEKEIDKVMKQCMRMPITAVGEANLKNLEEMELTFQFMDIRLNELMTKKELDNFIETMPGQLFQAYCLSRQYYGLPNKETIDFLLKLKEEYKDSMIEICAGNALFQPYLNIPATDNYGQQRDLRKRYYRACGQVPIAYKNSAVINMDAHEAIDYFKPKVVFGSYVTQGWHQDFSDDYKRLAGCDVFSPREWEFFEQGVEVYVCLCSETSHRDKYVLNNPDLFTVEKHYITNARSTGNTFLAVIRRNK